MSWLIQHEKSHEVLTTIIEEIEKNTRHSIALNDQLIKRFSSIFKVIPEETRFFIDLYKLGFPIDIKPNLAIECKHGHHFPLPFSEPVYSTICCVRNGRVIALRLSNKNINTLPESIGNLRRVRFLHLAHNNLTTLPQSVKSLTRLRYLSLFNTNLKKLPDLMYSFRKLRHLDIKWTNITSTPDSLMMIAKRNFSMKFIAEEVSPLEAPILGLIELISKVKLEKIGQHYNIHDYDFPRNLHYYKIDEEGHVIGLYVFNQFDPLLGIFPNQLCNLRYLEELYLSNNEIQRIPDSIGNLSSLKKLDLSYNRLLHVPETFKKLKTLKYLNISYNNIKEIPEFLNDLRSLERLSCANRNITEFPKSLLAKKQRTRSYYKKFCINS
jgi:Leucine-rich repeat (LRR) protein